MSLHNYNSTAALWPQSEIKDPNFEEFGKDIVFTELENGLRVLVLNDPWDRGTEMRMFINAGAMHQPLTKRGVAHFTEHFVHQGTAQFSNRKAWMEFVDDFNLERNAATGGEEQSYYVVSDNDHKSLRAAATYLSQIVFHPTFPEAKFEKEKQVIISERKRHDTSPTRTVGDIFRDYIYPDNHPLAKGGVLGEVEDIEAITSQDVVDFYHRYFVPQNMILTIVGGAEVETYLQLAAEFFNVSRDGDWIVNPQLQWQRDLPGEGLITVEKDYEHIYSTILVSIPRDRGLRRLTPEVSIVGLVEFALYKRLFEEIRENRGLAYTLRVDNTRWHNEDYTFEVSGEFAPKHYAEAKSIIQDTLMNLNNFSISADELRRGITRKTSMRWIRGGREMISATARSLYSYGQFISPNYYAQRVNSLSQEEVNTNAREILGNLPLEIVEVGPLSKV